MDRCQYLAFKVNIYDLLYNSVDEDTQETIKFLFKDESIKVEVIKVQKQYGGDDCGQLLLLILYSWLRKEIHHR